MSGINNEYNEHEIGGSVSAGTSMFSDLFRRFGQPPMVVPEADEACRTYYQEILHIKARLEEIDASNRGIDRIVVNADGTLTVYYSDGTTYTSPSLKGADGQDGRDGVDGKDGQDGAPGRDGQDGQNGQDGTNGITPNITATATVDNTPGVAEVSVVHSGTIENPIFTFNFVHLKGDTGATGAPGQDGVSPTAYVTQTGQNEVTFTVIDGNGTTTATLTGEAGAPGRDGQDGQDGEDGVSPIVTVTDITGGHRVTISDADGTQSFDVLDGAPGQNGAPGQPGQNGVSPVVTVTDITGGHQVSITDATSTQTFNVLNGQDGTNGTNGVSPVIDVVTITGGHRVDITDAQGSQSFNVLDGQDGAPGQPGQNGTDGVTPDITMTATTDATSSANPTVTVTKGGTLANPTYNLALSGFKGQPGANGQGVPAGGTAGQVLQKVDGTDYNTEWATPSGGGYTPKVYTYSATITINNYVAALQNNTSSWAMQCDQVYIGSDFYSGSEYLTTPQVFDLYKAGKGYLILRSYQHSSGSHGGTYDYNLLCSMYYDGSYQVTGCGRYAPTDSASTKQLFFIRTAQ